MSLIRNTKVKIKGGSPFWGVVGRWSKMYENNGLMDFFIKHRAYFSSIPDDAKKVWIVGKSLKEAYRRNKIKYIGGEKFAEEFGKLLAGLCEAPD